MLRTTQQGKWRQNCKRGGICGRGTRGGYEVTKCYTRDSKKNEPDYCGQCRFGWRRPLVSVNDWCCTELDLKIHRDCKCQAEYASECPEVLSNSGNSANGMHGGYGSGSGRIGHGIEDGYGLELAGGARDGYASGSGNGGEDVSYKHIEASKAFCKSPQNGDWTTQELKSKQPDLNWYIDFGNGVCHIGNNGGVEKCAQICKDIDGCRYFSVSTTTYCYACFIYKTCDNPISSQYDYKIYEMQKGGANHRLDASFFGCHGSKIALKTQYSSQNYILALPDGHGVNANGTSTEKGITFEVEDYGVNAATNERIIALKSVYGNYLSASECKNPSDPSDPQCDVTADSNNADDVGAKFEVKHNKKNQYWFQTHWTLKDTLGREKPLYLKPYSNGYLKGDGTRYDLRKWAKFTPECVEAHVNGGIAMEECYKSGNSLKGCPYGNLASCYKYCKTHKTSMTFINCAESCDRDC